MYTHFFAAKKATADDAAAMIKASMHVAFSGYSQAGYPKDVVQALCDRKMVEPDFTIRVTTSANLSWIDEKLAGSSLVSHRFPMVAHKSLSKAVNAAQVSYCEQQMHKIPRLLRSRCLGPIDVLVVEALGFDQEGALIPTNAIGMLDILMETAEKIIVEVNHAQPQGLRELCDIYQVQQQPIPLVQAAQRIGVSSIPFDRRKLLAVVETQSPEYSTQLIRPNEQSGKIARHLYDFLEVEYRTLPPVQTGFGALSDALTLGFADTNFKDVEFFCGGAGEAALSLLASGKAKTVSTGGLGMNDWVRNFLDSTANLKDSLVIRNAQVSNSGEVINRLGLVALNTGIEVDIYGNVNSSHLYGTHVINGIGGGAHFAHESGLSVVLIPSEAKAGTISCIVPMVSHQDINEHDVDIVITENGVADLRGLDDIAKAGKIIEVCASERYKTALSSYLESAKREAGGHHPQLAEQAFGWYRRLKETGSMEMEG